MPDIIPVAICRWPGNQDLPLPEYQSEHAAGMDLHAAVTDPVILKPVTWREAGDTASGIVLVPCGFSMAVPVGFEAQIRPRSGLAARHGVTMPNTPGTIDADYRGQVQVPLINLGAEPFTILRGMRIAQMIVKPVPRVQWQEVAELPPTQRGAGGFGHTGR